MAKLLVKKRKLVTPLKPFVSSMAFIPLAYLSVGQRNALKEELTVKVMIPSGVREDPTFTEKIVTSYTESVRGYIGLPRHFGLQRFSDLDFVDKTVNGDSVPNAYQGIKPIKPRDEQQRDYFQRIAEISQSDKFTDFIAVAKTGSGKTAAAINAAIVTGKPQLIVVHTNRLKDGWIGSHELKKGIRFFLGDEFVDNYVGIIQQDRCDFRNKLIGIALVHSLAVRQYPADFYTHWHGVTFDELHKHIAPHFAKVPMLFPQKVRGGMTATLRDDALGRIAHWHFGPVRVTSEQEILKPDVYICTYKARVTSQQMNLYSDHTELTSLSQLKERNKVIASIAYHRGYLRNRNILIIGDRVHQLQEIRNLLKGMGVKWSALGLYTGKVYTGRIKARVKKGDKFEALIAPDGRDTFKTLKEAKFAVKLLRKTDGKNYEAKYEEDSYKVSDEYYRRMETRCSIFLTTYGIFEAGNDIAKLDMGIEATPRRDQRQSIGRILRQHEGKKTPEWYSLSDELTLINSSGEEELLEEYLRSTTARKQSFRQQNARIINVHNVKAKFKNNNLRN